MNFPQRKPNRLRGYDYLREGLYFITVCSKDKRNVLGTMQSPCDVFTAPSVQLSRCGKITEKYILRINGLDSFVIMPNHIHMIITLTADNAFSGERLSPAKSISQKIQSFKILTSKEIGTPVFSAHITIT